MRTPFLVVGLVVMGLLLTVSTASAQTEADKATATFENGVLRLTFPRAEAVKARQIRISPTTDGQSTNGSTGTAVETGDKKQS